MRQMLLVLRVALDCDTTFFVAVILRSYLHATTALSVASFPTTRGSVEAFVSHYMRGRIKPGGAPTKLFLIALLQRTAACPCLMAPKQLVSIWQNNVPGFKKFDKVKMKWYLKQAQEKLSIAVGAMARPTKYLEGVGIANGTVGVLDYVFRMRRHRARRQRYKTNRKQKLLCEALDREAMADKKLLQSHFQQSVQANTLEKVITQLTNTSKEAAANDRKVKELQGAIDKASRKINTMRTDQDIGIYQQASTCCTEGPAQWGEISPSAGERRSCIQSQSGEVNSQGTHQSHRNLSSASWPDGIAGTTSSA